MRFSLVCITPGTGTSNVSRAQLFVCYGNKVNLQGPSWAFRNQNITISILHLTHCTVDRVDGLFPAGVLLRSSRQTVLLVQMELEPHSKSIQFSFQSDRQPDLPNFPGAQAFQFLQVSEPSESIERPTRLQHGLQTKSKTEEKNI
ncbi:hypothetical protein XENOCAPTIV_023362 [Xenoophorus captivus]|uniref:Uncharacterized protein n=1 Tax=Xenoophorus captivus TaxID=1517983 RepID=A0ABV0RBL8_9TELE